ncbi:MAG: ATP-binding protein [Planctomycetota bacterium]
MVRYGPLGDGAGERLAPDERAAVARLDDRLPGLPDLDTVLATIAESLASVAPCDRYCIALLDADGEQLVSRAIWAAYEPLVLTPGYRAPFAGSSLEAVIERRSVRVICDLPAYLERKPQSVATRALVREGVAANMTCPLIVDDRVIGVFFRSSRVPAAYGEEHVALQTALARRLSQTVEKLWRIEQLDAANRNYMEMLGFVVHELKSPLSGIVMDADLALGGYLGEVDSRQRRQYEKINAKAEYLLEMVGEYLDLARLETGSLEPELREGVEPVSAVIEPATEVVAPQLREREIRLERALPDGLELRCDPRLLKIVAVNLLGNAIKYGNQGGVVRVTLTGDEREVSLCVWNEGPGFHPASQARLFRKFSRLDEPELKARKGTGVGLYTCWRIARLHGGRIEAASEPGAWASFTLRLPRQGPG